MPSFLSDPSTATYAIIAVMVFISLVLALKKREKKQLISAIIAVMALVSLIVIDQVYESSRESCVRSLNEMATASKNKDNTELFKHISDQFSANGLDKSKLRGLVERAKSFNIEGVSFFDIGRPSFVEKDAKTVEQGFRAQLIGQPQTQRYVVGTFTKEADGVWRLIGFKIYDAMKGTNGPEEPLPGV
jgi:hypothetical protein